MPRLFVALEIPREAALSLSLLRGGLHGARWIDVENYHITLRFIGDVDAPTADELVHALDRVHRPEFLLSLVGMGSFGSRKPHSLWAGVSASPDLIALQAEIERICQRLRLKTRPPQIYAPRHPGAPARRARRRCGGLSVGAQQFPHRSVHGVPFCRSVIARVRRRWPLCHRGSLSAARRASAADTGSCHLEFVGQYALTSARGQ